MVLLVSPLSLTSSEVTDRFRIRFRFLDHYNQRRIGWLWTAFGREARARREVAEQGLPIAVSFCVRAVPMSRQYRWCKGANDIVIDAWYAPLGRTMAEHRAIQP
jgi:hypothetical protein